MVWKSTTRTCKQGNKGVRGEGGIHSMCNSNQQPQCVYVCTDCNTPCTRSVPPCQPHEEEEEPYLLKGMLHLLLCLYPVPTPCTPPTAPVVSLPALPTQSPEI